MRLKLIHHVLPLIGALGSTFGHAQTKNFIPLPKPKGTGKSISFRPLTFSDIKLKGVKATDTIHLPNGQVVVAGDYLASLNSLEAKLNQAGYSLRTAPRHVNIPSEPEDPALRKAIQGSLDKLVDPSVDQSVKPDIPHLNVPLHYNLSDFDTSKLTPSQIKNLSGQIASFNSKGYTGDVLNGVAVNLKQLRGQNVAPLLGYSALTEKAKPRPKPLPQAADVPFSDSKAYNWSLGCPVFGIALDYVESYDGNIHVTSKQAFDPKKSWLNANFSGLVLATLLDLPAKEILRVDGKCEGKGKSSTEFNSTVSGDLYYDGNQVWSKTFHLGNGGNFDDSAALPFDISQQYGFEFLPGMFIQGSVGINGAVGVEFSGYDFGIALSANVTPFVKARVYVQAAVGIGFSVAGVTIGPDAGLKAEFLLLDDKLDMGCNVALGLKGGVGLSEELFLRNDFKAFQGSITGFMNIPYIGDWNYTLIKNNGYEQHSTIYDDKWFTPLLIKL